MVVDQPLQGNLRFGLLLEALDKLAEEAALGTRGVLTRRPGRHRGGRQHPRAEPRRRERDVHLVGEQLNHVGRTSMEVGLRVTQEGEPGTPPLHIASCYFTMVARLGVGDEARSVPLPPLDLVDELAKRRARRAEERREEYRRQRRRRRRSPRTATSSSSSLACTGRRRSPGSPGSSRASSSPRPGSVCSRSRRTSGEIFGGYVMRRAYELSSICAELAAPGSAGHGGRQPRELLRPGAARRHAPLHEPCRGHLGQPRLRGGEHRAPEPQSQRPRISNSCLFTFVNLDRDMRPQPALPVYPTTFAEDARLLAARRRHSALIRHAGRGWIASARGIDDAAPWDPPRRCERRRLDLRGEFAAHEDRIRHSRRRAA